MTLPDILKIIGNARVALLFLLSAALLCGLPGTNHAQSAGAESLAEGLIQALNSNVVEGKRLRDIEGMREFYKESGFTPLWLTRDGQPDDTAATALKSLEVSWTHGLNPLTYHVELIRGVLEQKRSMTPYDFEMLLSDAVIRYGRDLTGMRVTPASVGQSSHYWQPPMRGHDILVWVAKNRGDVKGALEKLAPQGRLYQKLRRNLVHTLSETDGQSRPPVRINGLLKPGQYHDAVPVIRSYLGVSTIPPEGAAYYDDGLAQRVMAYQDEHGMAADGIIGPSTQKILNLSRMDKINQLVANLERQRWMDRVKPDKYVMVNIPSATLWAVENGRTAIQMKVIVGKETRPTNSFKTTINGVRFNPTWTVPPTIKREDYLPKLAEDPEYLSKRGIDIIYDGKTVDPTTVDWATLPWEQARNLTMRQSGGPTNPLGRIRILMPNNYNIYLHDTNDRTVFARNMRTLSSGCIRIEKPEQLANFILSENENWSDQKMQELLDAGKMRDIAAQDKIPVYLVYNTVWEKSGGRLVYGYDLYGQDDQLMGVIRQINGFEAPENAAALAKSRGFDDKAGLD